MLGQGLEFARLGDAVLVGVLPDFHIGELGVLGIEDAIAIAVEVLERIEAIAGLLAVGFDGVDAEQLAAIVDLAIAIAVQHEEAVVALDPAGAGLQAVAIEVEGDAGIGADGLDAVAVKIKAERVAAFDEGVGRVKVVIDLGHYS